MKETRIPRPAGLTQASRFLSTQVKNKEEYKKELEKIRNKVIRSYIQNGYSLNGRPASLEELAEWLGISGMELLVKIQRQVRSMGLIVEERDAGDLYKAFLAMALQATLADRQAIDNQAHILLSSQANEYKAFISHEVNGALKLKLDATKNLLEAAKMLKLDSPRVPTDLDPMDKTKNQYLTTFEAIELMRGEAGRPSALEPKTLAGLKAKYEGEEIWPEVNAKNQEGLTKAERSTNFLHKTEPITHENKRHQSGEYEEVEVLGDY